MATDLQKYTIALIGAGAMGSAILSGWCDATTGAAKDLSGENFIVVDPSADKCERIASTFGSSTCTDIADLADVPVDMILLAVKPQVMPEVLEQVAKLPSLVSDPPLVVTIAAGLPCAMYEKVFGPHVAVVRVMPNMPLQVRSGASVVAQGAFATAADAQFIADLFGCLGFSAIVDESQIDAVCAISGGGPAYVAKFIEDLTEAGVRAGLNAALASQLALSTVAGSCKILEDTPTSPEQLRISVCSPGGTTLAALSAMDRAGFSDAIGSGIEAAIQRAKELAS